jgi:hypothetical protein
LFQRAKLPFTMRSSPKKSKTDNRPEVFRVP